MEIKKKTIDKLTKYFNELAAINDGTFTAAEARVLRSKYRITVGYQSIANEIGLFKPLSNKRYNCTKVVYHPIDSRKVIEAFYKKYPSVLTTRSKRQLKDFKEEVLKKAKNPPMPLAAMSDEQIRQRFAGLQDKPEPKTNWVSPDQLKEMAEKLVETDNIQTKERIAALEQQKPTKKFSLLWGLIKWEK